MKCYPEGEEVWGREEGENSSRQSKEPVPSCGSQKSHMTNGRDFKKFIIGGSSKVKEKNHVR